MIRASWITLLAIVVLSNFTVAAQQGVWWPQFRGPNSSGLGGGKPPIQFGPGQNVQWKTAVGSGLSSPIIWAERVFLTEFDQASRKLSTVCIDRRTGKVQWRRAVAVEKLVPTMRIRASCSGAPPWVAVTVPCNVP